MNSGSHMFIANGKVNNPIFNMIKNNKYTHFLPKISTLDARKNGLSVLLITMELYILIKVQQKLC